MRIFVTGSTGFVGSAVVQELLGAGHEVLGLVRSDAAAASLSAAGAKPHRGDLEDLESLRAGAAASDGVIHTAFVHDFANINASCETDKRAIEALGETLEGSGRPLIVTSGVAGIAPGGIATEQDTFPFNPAWPRVSEATGFSFTDRGVRAMSVRLAPSVHGDGDHGFIPIVINIAREKGASAYIGEGLNRWPAVHRRDTAVLYRLAIEKGAAGERFHGVAEEGVRFRDVAEVIAKQLDMPLVSKTAADAGEHFGWFALFAGLDCAASNAQTRERLGWQPSHPGLLADLERGRYFESKAAAM
jgi:nucleoside-diphosphate-sugar epimerase